MKWKAALFNIGDIVRDPGREPAPGDPPITGTVISTRVYGDLSIRWNLPEPNITSHSQAYAAAHIENLTKPFDPHPAP